MGGNGGLLFRHGEGIHAGQPQQQQGQGRQTRSGSQGRAPPVDALGSQAGAQEPLAQRHQLAQGALNEQAAAPRRQGHGAQGDFGDQAQGAPAAGEEAHQVISRHIFDHLPPRLGRDPIGPHQADADQLVADAQIPLAVAAREAPGHQAADAAAPQGPTAPGPIDGQPLALLP